MVHLSILFFLNIQNKQNLNQQQINLYSFNKFKWLYFIVYYDVQGVPDNMSTKLVNRKLQDIQKR